MNKFTKPVLFTFGNFYLAGIHAGIQAAHVCTALASKYQGRHRPASPLYEEWTLAPTMNVRHAGMCRDITSQFAEFTKLSSNYPYAAFYEEAGALGVGIQPMTCWGVILPAEVYLGAESSHHNALLEYGTHFQEESAEQYILNLIKTTSLAK